MLGVAHGILWCPRCGTIKSLGWYKPEFQEPKIVQRAFTLCEAALGTFDDPEALRVAERAVRECVECARSA